METDKGSIPASGRNATLTFCSARPKGEGEVRNKHRTFQMATQFVVRAVEQKVSSQGSFMRKQKEKKMYLCHH